MIWRKVTCSGCGTRARLGPGMARHWCTVTNSDGDADLRLLAAMPGPGQADLAGDAL